MCIEMEISALFVRLITWLNSYSRAETASVSHSAARFAPPNRHQSANNDNTRC